MTNKIWRGENCHWLSPPLWPFTSLKHFFVSPCPWPFPEKALFHLKLLIPVSCHLFFSPPSLIIISDNTPIEDIYIAFYIFSSLFWQSKIYSFVNFFFFFFIYRFVLSVKKTKIDILLFETLDVIMFIFCMLVEDGWPLVILAVKPFSFLFFLTFITALLAPKLFAFGLKRFLLLKDVKSKNPNSLFHFLFVTCVEIFLLQNLLDCAFPFFLILF